MKLPKLKANRRRSCYPDYMQTGERSSDVAALPAGYSIPRGAKLVRITEAYRDLKDEIPCGLPGCHQGHKNGFVVQFTCDGVAGEGVVGKDCGRKYFGLEDWKTHVNALRARERLAAVNADLAAAVAACHELLPHVEVLKDVADQMESLRKFLRIKTPQFAALCEDAGWRQNGVLKWEMCDGRSTTVSSLRLPGREFWFRKDLAARIGGLEADLRLFPDRAAVAKMPKHVSHLLTVLGAPHERARELCRMVAGDLRALLPDNFARVFRVHGILNPHSNLRLDGRKLQMERSSSWGEPERPVSWETRFDFDCVPTLAQRVEAVAESLSLRLAA